MDIQTNAPTTRLSRAFRPSFGVSFMSDDARRLLLEQLPKGSLGRVSFTLDWAAGQSRDPADYVRIVRDSLTREVLPFVEHGAEALIGIAGTPRWLSRRPDLNTQNPTSGWREWKTHPPRRGEEYARLVVDSVKATHEILGSFDRWLIAGPGNENELTDFYRGSMADWFTQCTVMHVAAKAYHSQVRIAGPCAAGALAARQGDTDRRPLTQRYLEHLATQRLSPDEVNFHHYMGELNTPDVLATTSAIRDWLAAHGHPTTLPLSVGEWSLFVTDEPRKDTSEGAAYLLCQLHEFERCGVAAHTWSFAQDIEGGGYRGGYGFITRRPTLPKASLFAQVMLGMLYPERVALARSEEETRAHVYGLATRAAGGYRVLISRWDSSAQATELKVPVNLPGVTLSEWTVHSIDPEHSNPIERYRAVLRAGRSQVDAESAARETKLDVLTRGTGGTARAISVAPRAAYLIDLRPVAK